MYRETRELLAAEETDRSDLLQAMIPVSREDTWWMSTVQNMVCDFGQCLRSGEPHCDRIAGLVRFVADEGLAADALCAMERAQVDLQLAAVAISGGMEPDLMFGGTEILDRCVRQVLSLIDLSREEAEQRGRFLTLIHREYGADQRQSHLEQIRELRKIKNSLLFLKDVHPFISSDELRSTVDMWLETRRVLP